MHIRGIVARTVLAGALACAFAAAQSNAPAHELDVPYVPSPNFIVDAMLKLADVKKTDHVFDLGCGDGRIVIAAARHYGARGTGIDIDPERIREAQANAKKAGVENLVTFKEGDLFDSAIGEATVVTLYLLPEVNMRLRPKLWRDLKPGTRVVSHTFEMEDWRPGKVAEESGRRLYLWTIPKPAAPAVK